MCQIIAKSGSLILPHEKLVSSCTVNPDGWGIMGVDRGKVMYRTHYSGKNDPDKVAKALEEYKSLDKVYLHLRFKTKGKVDAESCHPFKIYSQGNNKLMLMHNGTLSDFGSADTVDSLDFGMKIVSPLYERMLAYTDKPLDDPLFQQIVQKYAGSWSKILLMDEDSSFVTNYEDGEEFTDEETGEIWWASNGYSFNRSHRQPSTTVSNTNYSKSSGSSVSTNGKVYQGGWVNPKDIEVKSNTQTTDYDYDNTGKDERDAPFPEQEVRMTFIEKLEEESGVYGEIDLYDLPDMTYDDVQNLVDLRPDMAVLLIMDLLLEMAYDS